MKKLRNIQISRSLYENILLIVLSITLAVSVTSCSTNSMVVDNYENYLKVIGSEFINSLDDNDNYSDTQKKLFKQLHESSKGIINETRK